MPGVVRFSYNEPVAHGFHGLASELDGVPLPQSTTSNFSEVVDPRSIDSLEVFTGAFPAEFGGSRQAAVINILSHRATDLTKKAEGSFTLGAGSYGSAQTSFTESLRAGNSRIFLNGNLERSDRGIDSPTFVPIGDSSNRANLFLRTITNVGARDSLAFDLSGGTASFQIPINTSASPNDAVVVPSATSDVQREYDRFINLVYSSNAASGNAYTQIAPWYRFGRLAYDGDIPSDLKRTQLIAPQLRNSSVNRVETPIGATWRPGRTTITSNGELGMAKGLQFAWVASVAMCGTLLGHALAYALEGRSLADGHHGYFGLMLEIVLGSAFLGCALIVGRAIASRGLRRMHALPPLLQLWFIVASLQIAGFAIIELLEGSAPNATGCGVEALIALLVAVAITLFCNVVERCAQAIRYAYAPRVQSPRASTRRLTLPIDAARSLAMCAGVRRFKRPPPIIG